MHIDRTQREGLLLILLTVTGYSLFSVWIRNISDTLSPEDIATWRFGFALPLLWLYLRQRNPRSNGVMPRKRLMLTGTLMTLGALTAIYGLKLLPVPIFIVLAYTYPAMVALITTLRGERLEPVAWFAVVMTLVGAILSAGELFEGLQAGMRVDGILISLLNALVIAIYFVVMSRLMRGVTDAPRASSFTILGATIPLLLLIPFRGLTLPSSPGDWIGLIGLGLTSTVLPIVSLSAGIRRLGAPRAAILSTFEIVLVLVWSELLLHEDVTLQQVVGAALIFASILLLQWRQIRPRNTALPLPQNP